MKYIIARLAALSLISSSLLLPVVAQAVAATDVACTGCVGTTDIGNLAVTNAKLGANAVNSAKISDGSIANADISGTAGIDATKISGTAWTALNDGSLTGLDADYLDGLTSSQFLRADQSGTLSGSLTVSSSNARILFRDTDQVLPSGLWHIRQDGISFFIERNTAAAGDFSTVETPFTIVEGGDVGIGTVSPNNKFTVVGGSDSWSGSFFGLSTADQVRLGTYGGTATVGANNSTGGAWANLALNPGGGNVGIGTTSPDSALDIYGDAATITVGSSSDTEHGIKITPEGYNERAYLYTTGGNSDHAGHLRLSNGGSDRTIADITLRNDAGTVVNYITNSGSSYLNGGNVGIGTTSPTAALDVRGEVNFGGDMVYASPDISDQGDASTVGSLAYLVVQLNSSGGGVIYLQPGTYTVSSQAIPLADNVSIIGSGPGSIIQASSGLEDDVINNESISLGDVGIRNVTLRDFQVIGNMKTDDTSGDEDTGTYQDCIDIGGSTTEVDYDTNITLSGLIISNCGRHGIVAKHIEELSMSDIFVHDNGNNAYHHNIYLSYVNNAMLNNIESKGSRYGTGIKIKHTNHATLSNIIAHDNAEYGIRVDSESNNITINSSSAYSNGISGFMMTSDDGPSHDVTLNGCAAYENTDNGVEVNQGNNTVISGCTIRDNGIDGIHLENADRTAITGNMIYGNTTYGVRIDASSSDGLLVGNVNSANGRDVGGTGTFTEKSSNI